MHGPTYMGNPLACAVALASIDLLLARRLAGPGPPHQPPARRPGWLRCAACRAWPTYGRSVRSGWSSSTTRSTWSRRPTPRWPQGVWLRPFRDLIYTMPPYVISDGELDRISSAASAEAVKAG